MSIGLNDNISVQAPKPLDARYGPFNSTGAALFYNGAAVRYQGLTVGVLNGSAVEDWWFKAGIADVDLVLKDSSSTNLANSILSAGTYV